MLIEQREVRLCRRTALFLQIEIYFFVSAKQRCDGDPRKTGDNVQENAISGLK